MPLLFEIEQTSKVGSAAEEIAELSGQRVRPTTGPVSLDDTAGSRELLRRMEARLRETGWEYVLSGEPFLEASVFDYVIRIIVILPPVAVLMWVTMVCSAVLCLTLLPTMMRSLSRTPRSVLPNRGGRSPRPPRRKR